MSTMSKRKAESWSLKIHDANVAVLTIPGALNRTRIFDIDVQLLARTGDAAAPAELGLSLEIDGSRQWSRSIPTLAPNEAESLDYHCRLVVEPGRDVRLRARASLKRTALVALSLAAVEAVED